jgi:hypothetical protein
MPKSNALQAVLERSAAQTQPKGEPPHQGSGGRKDPAKVEVAVEAAAGQPKFYRPSRDGKRLIAGHFSPKIAKQLKILAAEEETSVQALLEEAIELLFIKKARDKV